MEAAVLSPAMLTEVDRNSNSLTAELEVRKLQELVRKLERQNEQLRTRASGGGGGGGPYALHPSPACAIGFHLPSPPLSPTTTNAATPPRPLCHSSLGTLTPPEEPFHYFLPYTGGDRSAAVWEDEEEEEGEEEEGDASEPSLLDELELLDLDSLGCSDGADETWLYAPPKALAAAATGLADVALTPLQWCRQVLDRPKSEVEAARRSLSLRLEQVSRWRSSLSSPSLSLSPGRIAGVSPVPAPRCSTPQLSQRHVLHRTLSPVGKGRSPAAERTPMFLPHSAGRNHSFRRSALSPQSSLDSDLGSSEVEDDSIALGYKLHDLTDVQVMARLQEESLRQDYASTSSVLANRRSQSFSFQLCQLSAHTGLEEEDEEEEEEEDDEDYGLLPPPQPRLTRLPHSHTFSSVRDWRRSTTSLCTPPSTPSTPPPPCAGFAFQPLAPAPGLGSLCAFEHQGFRPGSDKLRRSMPNLVRAPSMPSVPVPTNPIASPSLLRNSLSFDSSSGLAHLHSYIPSPGQLQNRVQSVGNFSLSRQPLKATAYVSPTIKGSASTGHQSPSGGSCGSISGLGSSGIPQLSKAPSSTPSTPRSGLPRPASFMSTAASSAPRGKVAQPARSLLTPPKSLSTLSALRDCAWRDGCY